MNKVGSARDRLPKGISWFRKNPTHRRQSLILSIECPLKDIKHRKIVYLVILGFPIHKDSDCAITRIRFSSVS